MIHGLKVWPRFFDAVQSGKKTFEIRKNDRKFRVGDMLELQKFDPATRTYLQESLWVEVVYMLQDPHFGLQDGYCVLGIRLIPRPV